MKKKTLIIVLALACALTCALWLCACVDKNPESTGGNGTQTQAVETVTLDKSEITLEINGEATLTAIITPKSAADKPLTWSTSPAGIVKVDNGKVTAVSAGTATVVALDKASGKYAECAVTVNEPKSANEVTAEQWRSAFEGLESYTARATKFDGDKYERTAVGIKQIFAKEGEKFYKYEYSNSLWTRSVISEDAYNEVIEEAYSAFMIFKDEKAKFTYADGVYVGKNINADDNITVLNAEIKFENGKLQSIDYTFKYGSLNLKQSIGNIGTTNIELPAEFTEKQ